MRINTFLQIIFVAAQCKNVVNPKFGEEPSYCDEYEEKNE